MNSTSKFEKNSASQLRLSRGDKGALRILAVVAGLGGLAVLVWGAIQVIAWIRVPTPAVQLAADDPILGTSGELIGTFTGANVILPNLTIGVRSLFATGAGVGALTVAATFLVVSGLFWLMARGGHFHRSLTLATSLLGAVLAFGSLLEAGVIGFGSILAAEQLSGGAPATVFGSLTLNVGQLVAGFGLIALAFLLSRGEKLENDTEGLV